MPATPKKPPPKRKLPSRKRSRRQKQRVRYGPFALLALCFFLAVGLGLVCLRKSPPAPDSGRILKAGALRGVVVVVDPGHGGADPGAIRQGVSEAQLTYRMAATLAAVLHEAGAEVLFTVRSATLAELPKRGKPERPLAAPRDAHFLVDNKYVGARQDENPEDLYRRARLAAQVWRTRHATSPVYFLSLHFDALRQSKWRGGLIYYDLRLRQPPRLAQELARRWHATGLGGHRGAKTPRARELGVLNPAQNPVPESVLIELATLSNPQDRRDAQSPAWRWRVAEQLAEALAACTLKP